MRRKKLLLDSNDWHNANEWLAQRSVSDAESDGTWGWLCGISFFGIGGFGMWIDSQNTMVGAIVATVFCAIMQKISTTHID